MAVTKTASDKNTDKKIVLQLIGEKLQDAIKICNDNKGLINNPFLEQSLTSIHNRFCIAQLHESKAVSASRTKKVQFNNKSFEVKKKPDVAVKVNEYEHLTLSQIKEIAHKEYHLSTAGKDKKTLIAEIDWAKKGLKDMKANKKKANTGEEE